MFYAESLLSEYSKKTRSYSFAHLLHYPSQLSLQPRATFTQLPQLPPHLFDTFSKYSFESCFKYPGLIFYAVAWANFLAPFLRDC
jgi:hypothetical protein